MQTVKWTGTVDSYLVLLTSLMNWQTVNIFFAANAINISNMLTNSNLNNERIKTMNQTENSFISYKWMVIYWACLLR